MLERLRLPEEWGWAGGFVPFETTVLPSVLSSTFGAKFRFHSARPPPPPASSLGVRCDPGKCSLADLLRRFYRPHPSPSPRPSPSSGTPRKPAKVACFCQKPYRFVINLEKSRGTRRQMLIRRIRAPGRFGTGPFPVRFIEHIWR